MDAEKQYRAVFRATTPVVEGKRPILLISVGQEYHEGSKFLATIDLLNRSGFEHCTLMVADSLQRYNHFNTLSPDEAYALSLKLGDEWIERNKVILEQLKIPYKIIRWNEHYQHNSFVQIYRDELIKDYQTDLKIKNAIDSTINAYLERRNDTKDETNITRIIKNCFDYVIEESPILMALWANQGYDYIIYPKRMTNAMRAAYEKFVLSDYPEKVQWLSLRFRHKAI